MPSANVLEKKKQAVSNLTKILQESTSGVLVDYKGISVEDDTKLRRELREAGVEYTVVKNTLLRFAVKEAGFEDLQDVLTGTTALAVSKDDAIAPAKVLSKFADDKKDFFHIKAGFLDGEILDSEKVVAIGKLPSKEQLIGQLLSVLTGNIRGLAVAINAIAEKNGEGEEPAPQEA